MNHKRLSALLLSLALALSLAMPAMAANTMWYAEAQEFVTSNGIMIGDGVGFNPDGVVDRATVFQTLYNHQGKPAVKAEGSEWYAEAKAWAELVFPASKVDGVSMTEAADRGSVRELLADYAALTGFDASDLMIGDETGNLMLDKTLTRAELAQILLRLSKKDVKTYSQISDLQILATSDLHGKFYPWSYATNTASTAGSMTQLATAVKALRAENSLLIDAGDTVQDNSAQIFWGYDVHPMIAAMNAIGYDFWVTGNHEYNVGMPTLKKMIASQNAKTLVGNVYDEDGKPLADGYAIVEKDGVKIGVIGMVTPNIVRWDVENLAKCTVTDPAVETRKIIDKIGKDVDVLVGVMHMGLGNEFDVANSGVTDLLAACPEFDIMISAHDHTQIDGKEVNGVVTVQNKNMAQTMNEIHLILGKDADGWKLLNRTTKVHEIKNYDPDAALTEALKADHEKAIADAETVIGKMEGGSLAPENEIKEIPAAQLMDTALIDLINEVQMYYTGAKVSAAALFVEDANLHPGDIHKSDASLVYKYDNTLYKLQMTGAQLKEYMEWSVAYYNQYQPGDLTISFNPDVRLYNYDMFSGVNFDIDVSKPVGERIVNLTWPDGTPVKDDDSFEIAVNNYRANSQLLAAGTIFDADNLPVLLERDVRGDIGGVREQITEYIQTVKGGTITPVCDNNWKIIGNDWDEALHQKAVEQLAAGMLKIPTSEDGRTPNVKAITVNDLK